MDIAYRALSPADVKLLPGTFSQRADANREYVLSLRENALLQNHYLEARLWQTPIGNTYNWDNIGDVADSMHWGWESPTCQVRGQFLGHWLSAASRLGAMGDGVARARAESIVSGLRRCQDSNGGEWCFSIPPSYLEWTAKGNPTWAPQYVIHKTLMGLLDAWTYIGSEQALDIATNAARWFHRWTGQFRRAELDDLLDVETGGMLEAWADLYGATGVREHLDLIERYDRPRLFDRLLGGDDPLTNMHANTTIPEAHGAARAWEVTGDQRWRDIAEAYWRCAVTDRGAYCTGGQTCGEIWSPPFELSARLGPRTQEHCTVHNMIRLADYLFRWTGDPAYADYIERNTYNGILAQQHPRTGMVTYWLPLQPGARKRWGSATSDFWCCHGSLVQAQTRHNAYVWYESGDSIALAGYVPSEAKTVKDGVPVVLRLERHGLSEECSRPAFDAYRLSVSTEEAMSFALRIRLPWWLDGQARIKVNGEPEIVTGGPTSVHEIRREWRHDEIAIELPRGLHVERLPDAPETVAFMDGPHVLAGLVDEERALVGNVKRPETMLVPDNDREWGDWLQGFRTVGQNRGIRFVPIHEVVDEQYAVYFPVKEA